jgi:hypothetical protein
VAGLRTRVESRPVWSWLGDISAGSSHRQKFLNRSGASSVLAPVCRGPRSPGRSRSHVAACAGVLGIASWPEPRSDRIAHGRPWASSVRPAREMPRCRGVLSGMYLLTDGDRTGWLGRDQPHSLNYIRQFKWLAQHETRRYRQKYRQVEAIDHLRLPSSIRATAR